MIVSLDTALKMIAQKPKRSSTQSAAPTPPWAA
jgi:hypothetical protein